MAEYRQAWASPTDFFKRECRPAEHHSEWTGGATLYASYRRWAFLSDRGANKVGVFYSQLNQRLGKRRKVQYGIDLWPLWVKPSARQKPSESVRPPERVVEKAARRGTVVANVDAQFCDGLLKAGTELHWMEATPTERHFLDLEFQRQSNEGVAHPVSWLVIVFQGKRRRVPRDTVEMVV